MVLATAPRRAAGMEGHMTAFQMVSAMMIVLAVAPLLGGDLRNIR